MSSGRSGGGSGRGGGGARGGPGAYPNSALRRRAAAAADGGAVGSVVTAAPAAAAAGSAAPGGRLSRAPAKELSSLLEEWNKAPGALDELWSSLRAALRIAPAVAKGGKEEDQDAQTAHVQQLWEAVQAGARASGSRESLEVPSDIAVGMVRACICSIEGLAPNDEPKHSVLRLFLHAVSDAGERAPLTAKAASNLAMLLRRTSSLRTASLALHCLAQVAERAPAHVKSCASEAVEGMLATGRCLNANLVHNQGTNVGNLRDISSLLHSIVPLLAEVKEALEPSALAFIASLQPAAVTGAPYVMRKEMTAQGPSVSHTSSGTDLASDSAPEGVQRRITRDNSSVGSLKDEPQGVSAFVTQSQQCRVSALRVFKKLFRAFPKAFFGRWPLVLDFQSGETTRAALHSGASLPLLLAICQQDPSAQVRAAGLDAVLALLEAPNVKSWPVPLERGIAGSGGSFTSLADQVAATLRQTHALVFELMRRNSPADAHRALRAVGDLVTCTPYPKLRPGLLTECLVNVLPTVRTLVHLEAIDAVTHQAASAVVVVGAALKREDCSEELSRTVFEPLPATAPGMKPPQSWRSSPKVAVGEVGLPQMPSAGSSARPLRPSLADELLEAGLHIGRLASVSRPSTPRTAVQEQPAQRSTADAVAENRRARAEAGLTVAASNTSGEAGDVGLAVDIMAVVGRVAALRPATVPHRTWELLQAVVEMLLEHPGSSLRVRARKLLEDMLPIKSGASASGDADGKPAAALRRPPPGLAPRTAAQADAEGRAAGPPVEWCEELLQRLIGMMPEETHHLLRVSTVCCLPGVLLFALRGDEAGPRADGLRAELLAALGGRLSDGNGAVRAAAAQALGTAAPIWLTPAALAQRGVGDGLAPCVTVLQLLAGTFCDSATDVRSAAATAAALVVTTASDAEADGSRPGIVAAIASFPWATLLEALLPMCTDRPEKPRTSALRASGLLVEMLPAECGVSSGPPEAPPLLQRLAEMLAVGVAAPPAKCQWNACRAVGQVYQSKLFRESPLRFALHESLLPALCVQVGKADNMKVHIQAVQALAQLPRESALWSPAAGDQVLIALAKAALTLAPPPPGKKTHADGAANDEKSRTEERQRVTYAKQLRGELLVIGAHWADCAPPVSSDEARAAVLQAIPFLLEVMAEGSSSTALAAAAAASAEAKPGAPPRLSDSRRWRARLDEEGLLTSP